MSVHIEGMGLTGALLAWRLQLAGYPFSWHDTDAQHTAWKACTGAIYPAGKPGSIDASCYDWWERHFCELPEDLCEPAGYYFNHKKPPHEGTYPIIRRVEGNGQVLGLAEPPSYHVNAQLLVPWAREKFASHRSGPIVSESGQIIAHGFGERFARAYWGWTRKVRLEFDERMGLESCVRPAIYTRLGRFVMCYAYPTPGTPYWYAGSSLVHQTSMRELDPVPKYARWKAHLEQLTGGLVRVVEEGEFLQGWRPAQAREDDGKRWVSVRGDGIRRVITVPPLWNSGLRHFPRVWSGVAALLGLPRD